MFKNNILKQCLFLLITTIVAFGQNIIGLVFSKFLSRPFYNSIIFGSASLMGDHTLIESTPAFNNIGEDYISTFMGISIFAVLMGTIFGSLMFKKLKKEVDISKTVKIPAPQFTPMEFLLYVFLFLVLIYIGLVPTKLGYGKGINPAGGGFIVGFIFRNILDCMRKEKLDIPKVNLLGNFSLSMLLILNFMSLNLISMKSLYLLDYLIVIVQCIILMTFSYYVVFKIYGKNLLSLYVAAGLVGFSIGIPASTMSNIQCFTEEEGAMPLVLFIVPIVGAWLITIFNPLIIKLFL